MTAGRRDLKRPSGSRLASDIGEVWPRRLDINFERHFHVGPRQTLD